MYHHLNSFMPYDFTNNNSPITMQQSMFGGGYYTPPSPHVAGAGGLFGQMGGGMGNGFNNGQTPYQLTVPSGSPPGSSTTASTPTSGDNQAPGIKTSPGSNGTGQRKGPPETPTRPRRRNVNATTMLLSPGDDE
jgi:hypothetical protein